MGKERESDLAAELADEYGRWEWLKEHGGSDPLYSDADNMNLVRNHIFFIKKQMEERYGPDHGKYPEIYFRETPPETMKGYMADAAGIRDRAAEALDAYLADENFRYLLRHKEGLTAKEADGIHLDNVLGYAGGLADALRRDDLVVMRRHGVCPENYLRGFAECAEKMKQMIDGKSAVPPAGNGQMTLFQIGLENKQGSGGKKQERAR